MYSLNEKRDFFITVQQCLIVIFSRKVALSRCTGFEIMWLIEHATMADATIDVKSVCRNSGLARSKTYCCSELHSKQWHRPDTWDSIFSWRAIISRQSELLIFCIDCAGYDFLFSVVFFYELPVLRTTVWFDMKALTAPHCHTKVPGKFGPKPLRPRTPDRPKSISFLLGLLGTDCILWQ